MRPDPLNKFSRFLGVVLLITLYCSITDLRKAEAVTPKSPVPAEATFSCMLSKSAYGSPSLDEAVRRLHRFRDQVLMGSNIGRWVARVYYRVSASLAPSLEGDGLPGWALRLTTRGFLYAVKYFKTIGFGIGAVLITFLLGRGAIRRAVKVSALSLGKSTTDGQSLGLKWTSSYRTSSRTKSLK